MDQTDNLFGESQDVEYDKKPQAYQETEFVVHPQTLEQSIFIE